jgi:hypothetical protein
LKQTTRTRKIKEEKQKETEEVGVVDLFVKGLPDPDPSLFCTNADPSINKQKK